MRHTGVRQNMPTVKYHRLLGLHNWFSLSRMENRYSEALVLLHLVTRNQLE